MASVYSNITDFHNIFYIILPVNEQFPSAAWNSTHFVEALLFLAP
jgi:hypothetical protein